MAPCIGPLFITPINSLFVYPVLWLCNPTVPEDCLAGLYRYHFIILILRLQNVRSTYMQLYIITESGC